MHVKVLFIGDVVGTPGRNALKYALPELVRSRAVDCVIVNTENAASGSGLTPTLYKKFVDYGVHLMTLGDHVYRRTEIIPTLETSECIVRPANLPASAPGREFAVHQTAAGPKVAVVSLLGRLFLKMHANCPFAAAERVLALIPKEVRVVIVDIHAEATSEKIALGWHLDGRVSAVVGTHTHIPTADERILPKGAAYITDVGMTGPYDSVLGRLKERVISAMMTSVPTPFDVASDDVRVCGALITVESTTGRALSMERVRIDNPIPPAGTEPRP